MVCLPAVFAGNGIEADQYIGSLAGGRTYAFSGAGDFLVSGPILNSTNGAPINLTKSGAGTLTLAGTNTYGGTTTFSAGTVIVNGVLGTNTVNVAGGTLSGVGKIFGPATIQSGATFAPGTSAIGNLVISNSLTLASGSTTRIKIGKNGGVTTNDFVNGLAGVTCGGTVTVANTGSTALIAGDTFRIFSASSFSGAFSVASLPSLGINLAWTNQLAVDGTLAVVSTASTEPTNIIVSANGANLTLSWPTNHTGWRLLEQTNNLASGFSANTNNWGAVANSQQTNQIVLPIDPTLPAEFYRLIYP